MNIHRNFWGSKGVVERKLKSFFNFSFIAKNWGKKREKNSIFLLVFNPQMRSSLYWNKIQYFHSRANLCRDCAEGIMPVSSSFLRSMLCMLYLLAHMSFSTYHNLFSWKLSVFKEATASPKKILEKWRNFGKKGFKGINQIDRKKKKEMKVKFGWLLKKTF